MADDATRPRFAVDIDNVLARAEGEVQRIYKELTGTTWPRALYASAGGLDESSLNRELIETIFDRFHEEAIPVLPVLPSAKLALQILQHRYRIIMVTARRPTSRPQTLAWLCAHQIPFDELYHADQKTEVPEPITLAVDDHPTYAFGYGEIGIRVFLMDQPWNRTFTHPLVTRVSGWDAILHTLHYGPQRSSWSSRVSEFRPPQDLLRLLTPLPA